jgi:CxxC-x17-CxxC domain-containing protein
MTRDHYKYNISKRLSWITGIKTQISRILRGENRMAFDRRRSGHGQRFEERRDFGPREMHKAVCADCGKECEVPFKPSGDRPVYCKECFMKRKS